MDKDIGPFLQRLQDKYPNKEAAKSLLMNHIAEAVSALNRPIPFMETELRPSVGMGIFLERWMMTGVVDRYLGECCQEVDSHLEALAEKLGSSL